MEAQTHRRAPPSHMQIFDSKNKLKIHGTTYLSLFYKKKKRKTEKSFGLFAEKNVGFA